MDLTPQTRIEFFINDILGGSDNLTPVYRAEKYLAKIAGRTVSLPEAPQTRMEAYLAKIAGEDVEIPAAPQTRLETFLASIAGETVELPTPICRLEEWLLAWAESSGDELVSVTGIAPLLLANAVAKPITSLVQYGKCEQNGTPTPTAPVPIKCNNGELGLVDDELPAGYKRITGIKFDGDFWYDTGETLNGADDVTMTLANTSSSGQNVFGSYNGTAAGTKNFSLYLYGGGSTSGCYLRYGEQLVRPKFGSNERTITFGASGTSGFTTDVSVTPETFATEATAYIGMLPNSSSPAYTGSIMGNILVGTRLKYIPCERAQDGVVGYYETVKGVFLEPLGTGTPLKGNYDNSHLVLGVIGTPEVLTIGAQTANLADLFAVGDFSDTQDIISGAISRKCRAQVLYGTENWYVYNLSYNGMAFKPTGILKGSGSGSTVLATNAATTITGAYNSDKWYVNQRTGEVVFLDSAWYAVSDWKQLLATQYAAGAPVIIIYPLATAETDTADAQALSTENGDNTVSITANVSNIKLDAQYNART